MDEVESRSQLIGRSRMEENRNEEVRIRISGSQILQKLVNKETCSRSSFQLARSNCMSALRPGSSTLKYG